MKKIVSLFLLLLVFTAASQSSDSVTHHKFDIGFTFSPDYSYRSIQAGAADSWMKNFYDTLEVGKFSYTAGFNILFQLNKNFVIGSGLLFADKGEKTKKYTVTPVNNYNNHYYYIDIPLKANCYLTHKTVKLFLTGGVSANIYIDGQTNTEVVGFLEKRTLPLLSNVSHLNFSIIGGFGMDCPITERWYFRVEPSYRRSITPAVNTPIKKYFYSAGLNLGLFCKF